ncbi:MAG: DUF1700 domain-containing protein [Lachnospiraceae bacterium]|nr:DUF1700 domain-containing protein [Lachnospiraceae bacterium]
MSKSEYMECLGKRLRHLPREDYEKAMEYFQEYFQDAGTENEQQAIDDLGDPETAAQQIIRNMAVKNAEEGNRSVKRSISAVWIGILAVFAAPFAIPVVLGLGAAALGLALAAAGVMLAAVLTVAAVVLAAVLGLVGGVLMLFTTPANGIATLGISLILAGLGVLAVLGCGAVCRWIINGMIRLFGRFAGRGAVCKRRTDVEENGGKE